MLSNYLENKLLDHVFRTNAYTQPTNVYLALYAPSEGEWQANTSYSSGDTIIPTSGNWNGRMYRCTNSGTSDGTTEPTWPTTYGGTVNDNGVVWEEMTLDFQADDTLPEVSTSSTGYERIEVVREDASFKGTHGSASGASSGTGGNITNASALTFGTPIDDWGRISHWAWKDASTSGNMLWFGPLTTPKNVSNGDAEPEFGVDDLGMTLNVVPA